MLNIYIIKMLKSEIEDHDPFNGGRKASLTAFVYFLQLLPYLAIFPFLPYLMFLVYSSPYWYP